MPESAETLSFDTTGVCSVCRQVEFKQTAIDWSARRQELDTLIDAARGKGEYDCIVPFSGGKDSTYTLWYLVREMKLKPLVVRFDHGFMRSTLIDNNHRTFRKLGVDVLNFTPNWQVVRKLMFEALKRRGDFCWHCHTGIFAYPMRIAVEKRIPLVIWGEPSAEYASFYGYDEQEEVDERRFNTVVNLGINAEDMHGMLDDTISDYQVTARDLLPFTYPALHELRRLRLRSICLGSYIPWDVRRQVDLIKSELDWRGEEVEGVPPEYDYEKIECFMQGVRDYIKFLKRGFGRTRHLVSIDIRNGRMTREDAERLVAQYDGKRPGSLDIFLGYLGIDEADFMRLVAPHVVSPWEMPSMDWAASHKMNQKPWDFDRWSREDGTAPADTRQSDNGANRGR